MRCGSATRAERLAEGADHVLRARLPAPRSRTGPDVGELVVATKVRRPLLPRDLVARSRLVSELEAGVESPVRVVTAPAGYGKTTLVNHWLQSTGRPHAWVSLGAQDDSVEAFVLHVVAAMRQMSPHAMRRVAGFIRESALPSAGALCLALLNDLGDVDHAFVLVLDGTEVLRDRQTLQLLSALLEHPPAHVHLVLVGRWDPFLATASIRVATRISEIRAKDLRFTSEETLALLESSRVAGPTMAAAEAWTAATEGWITGLKLALAEGIGGSPGDPGVHALTRRVRTYLLSEVLGRQPDSVRRFLMDASILDRLCEPLCRALCDEPADGAEHVSDRSLQMLRDQGLFLVPLDEGGTWFRFHALLRGLLASLREGEGDVEREARLRQCAAEWLASNGHFEEAHWQALCSGDRTLAAEIVEAQADSMMDAGDWDALGRALQRLSVDVVDSRPRLLLAQGWVSLHQGRLDDAETAARRAEHITTSIDGGSASAIKSALARARGDVGASIAWAREALAQASIEPFDRGAAVANLYVGYWVTGDRERADALADPVLADARDGTARARERLLSVMCAMRWRDGDLEGLEATSALCERLAREEGLPRMMAVAELYRGLASYEHNEMFFAREHLVAALTAEEALTDSERLEARYGLARVQRAQGHHSAALGTAGLRLEGFDAPDQAAARAAAWTARAQRAELVLAYGHPRIALALVEPADGGPSDAASWHDPHLTVARLLLLQGDGASADRAREVLSALGVEDLERLRGRFRIERHCLLALLAAREGDHATASSQVGEALLLAEALGFLRYFVDLGAPLAEILKPLARHALHGPFVRRVLAAYYEAALASRSVEVVHDLSPAGPPAHLLTPRESETLRLLSQGLANHEIAELSFVSVDTVKTHLKNIYRKLHVRSRRQAVACAKGIGLLAEARGSWPEPREAILPRLG